MKKITGAYLLLLLGFHVSAQDTTETVPSANQIEEYHHQHEHDADDEADLKFKRNRFSKEDKEKAQQLQKRIDSGTTPKELLKEGISTKDLYGLKFQGGYIFYFFPKDSSGLVIGMKDLHYQYDTTVTRIFWSCRGKKTGATKKGIGSGQENTQLIKEAECTLYDPDAKKWMTSAAELCLKHKGNGYTDWFLPSKDELHQAYMALSFTGKISFKNKEYWSSSERDENFAWIEHFKHGGRKHEFFGQSAYMKFYNYYVRPVRKFE